MTRNRAAWELFFAIAMIGVGALTLYEMSKIKLVSQYDSAGPRFFPTVFAVALIGCGTVAIIQALVQRARETEELDYAPLVLISAGLLIQFLLVERIGWIPAATIQFALAARSFGRFGAVKSLLYGVVLASLTYVGFTGGLGLDLPPVPFLQRYLGFDQS